MRSISVALKRASKELLPAGFRTCRASPAHLTGELPPEKNWDAEKNEKSF